MFVRHNKKLSKKTVRKMAADLAAAIPGALSVMRPGRFDWIPEGRHALEIIDVYSQDGPDILPEIGEQFIEAHLSDRYYGPGYERGDWPNIFAVFMWLKANIPECFVWYGGDSSGVEAEEMTPEFLNRMWQHYVSHGHAPYVETPNPYMEKTKRPICDFCGGREMWQFRFGEIDGYRCEGCEYKVKAPRGTTDFSEMKDEEIKF